MKKLNTTHAFQEVFFTVLSITLLAGGASCWFAQQPELSPQQNRVFESSITTWQMGVGAIFGLLGGRAADIFHQKENQESKK